MTTTSPPQPPSAPPRRSGCTTSRSTGWPNPRRTAATLGRSARWYQGRKAGSSGLAAEDGAAYAATPADATVSPDCTGVPNRVGPPEPADVPVLAEIPELAALLEHLRMVDRLLSRAIDQLMVLTETGLAEATTGVGIDTWLRVIGRRTGTDIRMLRAATTVLRRIPTLHAAFRDGAVSWAQVRAVVLMVRPLPGHLDDAVDAGVADAISAATDAEPDALTRIIRWHLAALEPKAAAQEEQQADREEYLAMQPRLDGSGGRFWGECGPTSWAILDAALNHTGTTTPKSTAPGATADEPESDDRAAGPGRAAGSPVARSGRRRLRRLVDLLDQSTTSHGSSPARPQLLLRTDLDTLLDRDQTPAHLLTSLLGGIVRVTSDTARRLVDARGADLRTIVLDDCGAVVGVGRRRRLAPGWLTDATLAVHDTCCHPGCETGSRACQTDHARPWHTARPTDQPGRTDVDELAPLCAEHNRAKERDGWVVTQGADGSRRWSHTRSGLATTTLPATWRPPPAGPG